MEQENQRVAITKRLLKESMLRLLKKKELDKINVTELCREAGINRATFYRHYEIPRDVLMEIQRDLYHELRRQVSVPQKKEEVRPGIEKMCVFLDEHTEILRILIGNNSDADFSRFVNEVFQETICEFSHMDLVKKLNPEDIQLMTLYSAGGSFFVLRSWLMGSIKKNPVEMAACVYELLNKTNWEIIIDQIGIL